VETRGRTQTIILLAAGVFLFLRTTFAQNVDALRSDIYSKLKCCSCQVSFDKCFCPEAKEMKAYLDALIESAVPKEEIFYKMAKKFSLNTILDEQVKQDLKKRLIKEAGERRPQIILDSTYFDFGQVTKKHGKISRIFGLTNKGNSPLIIKNIKTFCPCAFVSLRVNENKSPYFSVEGSPKDWQAEIKPGDGAGLEIMIDLTSVHVRPGKVIREAAIVSNDPIYPELTITVEANLKD